MPDIMLVDDNQGFLDVAQEFIESFDDLHVVWVAKNGEDALKMLEQERPDLLIVDVSMPGMTGFDMAQRVKVRWPNLRLIILTLLDTEAHREAALEAGADAFVVKSSMDKDLIPVLRELVRG